MDYAEASYFDGYHFQHIALWKEMERVTRIRNEAIAIARAWR